MGILFCALLACVTCDIGTSEEYILGGRNAAPGQFPFIASLRGSTSIRPVCGGSIISNRWVLSGAFCTAVQFGNNKQRFHVWVGAHGRQDGHRHEVARIVNHPKYSTRYHFNDISAIQTTAPIQFNNRVQPVALPTANTLEKAVTMTAGWGWIGVS